MLVDHPETVLASAFPLLPSEAYMPGSHPVRWIILLCSALAAFGCAGTDAPQGATGSLSLDLVLAGGVEIDVVDWEITGNGMDMGGSVDVSAPGSTASVEVFGLPPGDEPYVVELSAISVDKEVTCRGSAQFDIQVGVTTDVMVMLSCKLPQELGGVRANGKFNICSQLTKVVVSPLQTSVGNDISLFSAATDEEGDPIAYLWSSGSGSIADPTAASTTYTCTEVGDDDITILVTDDGGSYCMSMWTVPVTCVAGEGNPCDGVICDDTGNECTTAACNPSTGQCETSNVADGTPCNDQTGTCMSGECVASDLCMNVVCDDTGNQCTTAACNPGTGQCETSNVDNGTACEGGAVELAVNGGFETGNLDGWTQFCESNGGTCAATTAQANGGSYSGNVNAPGDGANPLIKQANVGIGTVTPNSEVTISFDLFGSTGPGGVVFAEFFSEIDPAGVSKSEILSGGPLFPSATWTTYSFTVTTGPDVSNGVTLQLAAICGAVVDCTVDAYFDNVSIVFGSGGGAGTCQEGVCVPSAECVVDGDCPATGNECIDAVCNAGTCGTSNNTNACNDNTGTCNAGVCEPNAECVVDGDCPATGNECIDAVCNAGTCETSNNTNACNDNTGTCNAGECVPNAKVLYEQNFNLLDINGAFIGDGWRYFNFVFDSNGMDRFGGYSGNAPNGPQMCALVNDQGGPAQEPQQLSVYNDYNCCQPDIGHNNPTDVVQVNIFQEQTIAAEDVGKTIAFSFDAKRGNIAGSSTANAFIKTLDAGNQTNFVTQDTTNLPVTPEWNSFTITLDIIPELAGKTLQFGFQTNASNFESSGNYYDNVLVTVE
jgi:hypothetical protein